MKNSMTRSKRHQIIQNKKIVSMKDKCNQWLQTNNKFIIHGEIFNFQYLWKRMIDFCLKNNKNLE